ncbi:nucleoside recognition protein [bacterium 0.1xD8-71]|nr:nucleoside recognition protein [bacterium 0.1xD8-71]
MLNYIWAFMILIGVVYGAFTGKMAEVTNAALDSAGDAVSLCITMIGVMALWVGLMEIAQKSGLIAKLTRGIQPFISFLFPRIPKGHPAREYIATNLIANVLGLGWACTPAGLKAMEELAKLEAERGMPGYVSAGEGIFADGKKKGNKTGKSGGELPVSANGKSGRVASNEMCTFLILNISSLQLIPVNMIAYRRQYGSVNPAGIIAPAIVATFVSTAAAVVYCKGKDRRRRI